MNREDAAHQPRRLRVGWMVLLAVSVVLILHGGFWRIDGPETALENISERTSLDQSGFRVGEPSASDVIALVNRNYAVFEIGLGLMAGLASVSGFRHGSSRDWILSWVLVAALITIGANFFAASGGPGGVTVPYLGVAAIALVGQLLARPG